MEGLKPLRSSVGPPAEGEKKYFSRDKIVKKILRKLNDNQNLLIAAPRRIGKSSILKHIQKNPDDNQIIKYMIVQSVNSQEVFFKQLYNELINDKEIFAGIKGYFQKSSAAVKNYASRITGINLSGGVQIGDEKINYYDECIEIIDSFKTEKQIIIFVDEFPDTINNILAIDEALAINFIQKNRDLRIKFSDRNLQFVYTGSTGLKNVVRKLDKLDLINDLNTIIIPPFDNDEARELIQRLILGFQLEIESFNIDEDTIEYILKKITWKLPYYMQMIVEGLFEYYEDTEETIKNETIDYILSEIIKSKSSHSDYFENWYGRLKKAFKNQDFDFAVKVLNCISENGSITYQSFCDLSTKYKVSDKRYILDVLEHDGYISEIDKTYGFNSILLKEWWYTNVAT